MLLNAKILVPSPLKVQKKITRQNKASKILMAVVAKYNIGLPNNFRLTFT